MTADREHRRASSVSGSALVAGAALALLAVIAGAFGAHGLRGRISDQGLEVFQTAVSYQMYHALALVLVALLAGQGLSARCLGWSAGCFGAGTLCFSGSLYLLVLTEIRWVGPVTPVGGLLLIAGWALLAWAGIRRNQ